MLQHYPPPSPPAPCSLCKFKACSRYGLTFTVHMKRQKESWKCTEGKYMPCNGIQTVRIPASRTGEMGEEGALA